MTDTATVLRKAAELIEPEGAWTKGAFARCGSAPIGPLTANAECWCVLGALYAAASERRADPYVFDVIAMLCGHLGLRTRAELTDWNDRPFRTQAEVVQALRNAADQAEGGES